MTTQHQPCNPDRIEQSLAGRLTPDQQTQFEGHLEMCVTCRDRLESTAAEQEYWKEAAVHLRDDALDEQTGSTGSTVLAEPDGPDSSQGANVLRVADYFDATDDPRMLGRFGGYEIVGIIGCGGMGVVLKGFEPALDRYVAIKMLAPHLATSGAARTRFAREARAAAAVLHENVVAIHRVAEAKGMPFLVMPYMPGDSLQKRLDQQGPLQTAEILRIGMQIAAGLAAAHAQGLIHRDIKPGNILLDKGVERVTITDFGLARAADDASLTRSGVIAGTPQYMSPEQARGQPIDARSDLFSLGSVLYAMCVGRPPFRAETAFGVLHRISESHPTEIRQIAPETPEWLCEIIAKLHAKDPADRFQTAGEVADLLGRWLAHVQQPAVIPAPPHTGGGKRRERKFRLIAAAVAIGIIGLCAIVAYELPSPFGKWVTDELPSPDQPSVGARRGAGGEGEVTRSDAGPHPSPLPEAVGTTVIPDERTLQEDCRAVGKGISQIEQQWSQSPSPVDSKSWQTTVSGLNQRLDDLGRRIDRNLP